MIIGYDSCYCYICKEVTGHKLVKSDGFIVKVCPKCIDRLEHPFQEPRQDPHAVLPRSA